MVTMVDKVVSGILLEIGNNPERPGVGEILAVAVVEAIDVGCLLPGSLPTVVAARYC